MRLKRTFSIFVVALAVASCSSKNDFTEVRVMTWNLSVGIQLEPILGATNAADIPALVQTAWGQRATTDFRKRAGRIADAIQASGAELVGLQEVAEYFSGPTTTPPTPAGVVVDDFVAILLGELTARGLTYAVASTDATPQGEVANADIQLPGTQGQDYRILDREVVLAKAGVDVRQVRKGNYVAELVLRIAGSTQPFHYKRGWVAVDVMKGGKPFTFVSTHLEAFMPSVQAAQAQELLAMFPSSAPTLVVGDMNSDPTDAAWPAYGVLVSRTTGYADTEAEVGAATASCCYDDLLADPNAKLSRRVDLVLHSPHFAGASATLHGGMQSDYQSGLWPSDHAGYSAVVELD